MIYKVGICPTDLEGKIEIWEKFVEALSKFSGITLILEPIKNFREEKEKIDFEEFLLYFASPHVFSILYKKGYEPLASFKDQREYLLLLGVESLEELSKKEFLKVSLIDRPFFYIALFQFSKKFNFDFSKFQLIYEPSYEEILKRIFSKELDLGVVCKEYLSRLERKKVEEIKIYDEFTLDTSHVFMFNFRFNHLKDKIKGALLSIDKEILEELGYKELEVFSEERIKAFRNLILLNSFVLEFLKERKISEALLKSPYLGVLIYHERILYANPYVLKLFGYSEDEFYQLKPEEILYFEEDREKAKVIIRRRLQGEFFTQLYEEAILRTKDGKKFYATGYSNTIFYEDKYCGLVIIIDITKRKRLERVYEILRVTNKIFSEVASEEEFFKRLCEVLVKVLELKMIWVGAPDYERKEISPLFYFGYETESYFKAIRIYTSKFEAEGQGPIGRAFRENKVFIISDVVSDSTLIPWREEALKRRYLSVAVIPLSPYKEVSHLLVLYASEPYFFEEENKEILEELKRDLEFGLRKLSELKIQNLLTQALSRFKNFLIIVNEKGRIVNANKRVSEFLGISLEDLIGSPLEVAGFLVENKNLEEFIRKQKLEKPQKVFVRHISYEGLEYWLDFDIIPIKIEEEKKGYILTGDFVSKYLEFYNKLNQTQFYDSLTGTLNYNGFIKTLSQQLFQIEKAFLILIDIHNFSYLNIEYGSEYGDICLKEMVRHFYLERSISARVGADSFAIFISVKDEEEAKKVIKWLKKKIKEPLWVFGRTGWITLSYHVGIARFPEDGKDFETLWKSANIALSSAKRKDPNTIEFFNPVYAEEIFVCLKKKELVKRALKEELFVFYYQPYFDIHKLKVLGFEALVRVKEKDGSVHSPFEFIDILERCPYLGDFLKWSLRKLKEKILKWKIPISLNLSMNALKIEEILEKIKNIARFLKNKVNLNLELEITERIFAEDPEFIKKVLLQLKEAGARIFLDDFGTGYSSLIYLKDLPLDVIKIDKIFIKDLTKGKKEMGLVKTVIDLAHTLGMKALAEGVETKEQLEILDIMGCDYVQGFYFFPPLEEAEVEKFLKKHGLL